MKWGGVYHVHPVLKTAPESGKEEMEGVEGWVKKRFEEQKWMVGGVLECRIGLIFLRAGRAEQLKGKGKGKGKENEVRVWMRWRYRGLEGREGME
jgi:hypothetical protein